MDAYKHLDIHIVQILITNLRRFNRRSFKIIGNKRSNLTEVPQNIFNDAIMMEENIFREKVSQAKHIPHENMFLLFPYKIPKIV